MIPEAYRQKFRDYKKESNKPFVKYAREKERLLERWCTSEKVANSYDNLRQLILLGEFKNSVYPEVKTCINEKKTDTLDKAARMTDDYTLLHKLSFNKSSQQTSYKKPFYSTTSNKHLNIATNKHSLSTAGSPFKTEKSEPARLTFLPTCGYCKKKGHILSDCYILKRRQERKASSTLPTAFTVPNTSVLFGDFSVDKRSQSDTVLEGYEPFLSGGYISLLGQNAHSKPIKLL